MPNRRGRLPALRRPPGRVLAAVLAIALSASVGSVVPAVAETTRGPRAGDTRWGAVRVSRLLEPGAAGERVASRGPSAADRDLLRTLPRSARVGFHPATGRARFLAASRAVPLATATRLGREARSLGLAAGGAGGGPVRGAARGLAGGVPADAAARAFLAGAGPLFGLSDVRELRTTSVGSQGRGRSVVRFEQRRGGVPVLGGELVVGFSATGDLVSVAGELLPAGERVTTVPRLGRSDARRIAARWVAREAGVRPDVAVTRSEGLAIHDGRLLGGGGPGGARPVWAVDARAVGRDRGIVHRLVLVDALDGSVRDAPSRVSSALERRICDLENVRSREFECLRGGVTRGEGDPPAGRQQVDALYGLLEVVDGFFRSRFGRDGIDGAGSAFVATVRYCLPTWCPMQNAFWEWGPQQATFGDGWADVDDLVGHEYAHGVLDHENPLFYHYQSGALNESFADIVGEVLDQVDGWGNDAAGVRWLIGEDLPGGPVRDLRDPGRFGDPDRVRSPRWWTSASDSGGVHTNSGVGNKAASLIADGGRFNGRTIAGIGVERMIRIEYEAVRHHLTSASDYLDLHDALIGACVALAGTGDIALAHCGSVRDAVAATEMDLLPLANAPRRAPVCAPGRFPADAFLDDLEDPAAGRWAAVRLAGDRQPWHYPPNPNGNPDWDGRWASSGTLNLFGDDLARVTDAAIELADAVEVPPGGLLRFEHGYRFDAGSERYDGGVVEVSVDGGPWEDLGPRLVNGRYDGTLATGRGNPMGGRRAFTGDSAGWGASRADLSAYAGQRVRIRFRLASDDSGGSYGWYIDDVRIYRCVRDAEPPSGSVTIGDGREIVRDATQTLTIDARDEVSGLAALRVANGTALRDGLLRRGLELPVRRTLEWSLADTAWGGSAGDGRKVVAVQVRDAAGNWSAPITARVILDREPPIVRRPVVRLVRGAVVALDEPRVPVRVAFGARDLGTGVARTELERSRADGPWEPVDLGGEAATVADLHLASDPAVGPTVFRARARDRAGDWSDWVVSAGVRGSLVDDDAAGWELAGSWSGRRDEGALGGRVLASAEVGASAAVTVSGTEVAIVAPRGPDLGIAVVRIDGEVAGRVDLYAPSREGRRVAFAARLPVGSEHRVVVVVTGERSAASAGIGIELDALAILAG